MNSVGEVKQRDLLSRKTGVSRERAFSRFTSIFHRYRCVSSEMLQWRGKGRGKEFGRLRSFECVSRGWNSGYSARNSRNSRWRLERNWNTAHAPNLTDDYLQARRGLVVSLFFFFHKAGSGTAVELYIILSLKGESILINIVPDCTAYTIQQTIKSREGIVYNVKRSKEISSN